ncbi:MAG: acyloxyacyl hydrolase, partial [Desulfobacteraceae bacterium]|nr:acyloxyacyl hydrolase [Desulfobacteraceae bacterium]
MRLKRYAMLLLLALICLAPQPLFGDEIAWRSIGLNFTRHLSLGYRLQHMSNAVLYEHNPGLN